MSYSPTGSYPTGLTSPTDKRIGDAFPIIEEVYKHLPHLKYLAENANSLVAKQIELRGNTSLQSIEWAYQDTDEWFTLIAFTDLTGGIAIDDLINNLSQLLNDAKTYINDQINQSQALASQTQIWAQYAVDNIHRIGYDAPVAYSAGLVVNHHTFTVDYNGVLYSPLPSKIPFTTGAWDPSKWTLVQNLLNQKNLLVFDTYVEASAAAATLPDGQTVEILSEDGQRTRRKVASGVLGAAVSAAAVSILPSMAALRSAPANPGAIYRIEGSGEYRLDITDSTTPDNARDVLVDTRGGRWKLVTAGVWGASGSQFTQSVEHRFYADKSGAVRIGGSDPAPLDDQRNYWRGLPSGQSTNSWRDAIGLASFSLGRNGASPAYLSGTFGHDCVSYGVAGIAGGAGSATGDPDNPSAYSGYCSFAYGKNVIAFGEKSTALGEETRSGSRGSLAAGIFSETGPNNSTWPGGASDGIGAVAVGHRAKAFGDGAAALGHNVTTYGGALAIGKGISDAKPMEVPGGGLGLGYKVTKPTLQFTEGSSETQGVMLERGSRITYVNKDANEVAGSQEYTDIENSGGGGWARRVWSILRDGVLTPLFEMSAGGNDTVPSFKTRHENGRLGSNAMPWEYVFVKYAPVVTSDRRGKTVRAFDPKWLDAVRLVEYVCFTPKGSDGPTVGVIAQDVIVAFESVGASAFDCGVVCGTEEGGYSVNYTALQCLESAAARTR